MIRIILNNKDIVIPIFKALDLNSELSRDLVREAILPDYYFYFLILLAFIWGFSKKESKT